MLARSSATAARPASSLVRPSAKRCPMLPEQSKMMATDCACGRSPRTVIRVSSRGEASHSIVREAEAAATGSPTTMRWPRYQAVMSRTAVRFNSMLRAASESSCQGASAAGDTTRTPVRRAGPGRAAPGETSVVSLCSSASGGPATDSESQSEATPRGTPGRAVRLALFRVGSTSRVEGKMSLLGVSSRVAKPFHCEATALISAARRLRSRSPKLMPLLRTISSADSSSTRAL